MGLLVVGGSIVGHLAASIAGDEASRLVLILDYVYALVVALVLMLLCISTGLTIFTRWGVPFTCALDSLLFSLALGGGVLATLVLACGSLSLLYPSVFVGLGALVILLTWRELRQVPGLLRSSGESLRQQSGWFSLGLFGGFSAVMLTQALLPPLDWDSLMYHLEIPRQFLDQHRLFVPEDNLHVAFVQLAHMLYVPLLAMGSSSAPAILSLGFAIALGVAMFRVCYLYLDRLAARYILAVFWGSAMLVLVAVTPRIDVTVAFYLFLGHWALLKALFEAHPARPLCLSAVLLGMGCGIKYLGLIYGVAVLPLVLWLLFREGSSALGFLRLGSIALFLGGLASLPWLLKNWVILGGPLYPYFTGARTLEPWLVPLFSGGADPMSADPERLSLLDQARSSVNLVDFFLAPFRLTVEAEAAFYYPNVVWLAVPLCVFFLRSSAVLWLIGPAVLYVVVLVAYKSALNLRYFIPVIPVFTLIGMYVIVHLCQRWLPRGRAQHVLVVLCILAMIPSGWAMATRVTNKGTFPYLIGTSSPQQYLQSFPYGQMLTMVHQHVPPDSRVLMLFEARGYYFRVPVIQDNMLNNWTYLLQSPDLLGCFESSNISHVLVNVGALNHYVEKGLKLTQIRWEVFDPFARHCLVPVDKHAGFVLFRLKSSSPTS